MNEEQLILRNIQEQNRWWITGKVDAELAPSFKRNEYKRVKYVFFNKIRRFPVLSGPRRVGKSTIMFQIIDELLSKGVKPSRILFYTLDDFPNDNVTIKEVVRVYQKFVYPDQDYYLFIDEAQKDKTWRSYVKEIYDLNKKCLVMISGSSSVEIERDSGESGAARFLTIKIPTFSFYEFCEINGKHLNLPNVDVFKLHTLPLDEQTMIYNNIATLNSEFYRYLRLGGFPEYALSEDYNYVSRLIRDQVVSKAIRQDIPSSYPIRDVDALANLYAYFCYHSGDITKIETISSSIGIDRSTCNLYIDALEKANLIYISDQLDASGKKALKPKRKIYISDYGIRCAVTRINDIVTDDNELGMAIETVSLKHTRDYFLSVDNELYNVGYIRNDKGQEIDIVIQENGRDIQYVEAKYRHKAHIKDSDGIIVYGMKDVPGYVVSKEVDDFGLFDRNGTKLYRIPALAYAYLLGKNKE